MLDRGRGGGAYQREGGYLAGGFNIGFTAYFTIIVGSLYRGSTV